MGGIHISHRSSLKTVRDIKTAISKIRIPDRFDCDAEKTVYPEFFHGHYSGAYGFDVGLIYRAAPNGSKGWRLFFGCLDQTMDFYLTQKYTSDDPMNFDDFNHKWKESIFINLQPGQEIILKTTIANSGFPKAEIFDQDETRLCEMYIMTTEAAMKAFRNGGLFNTELNLVANRPYYPSKAFFSDVSISTEIFRESKRVNGVCVSENFNSKNSKLEKVYDDSGIIPSGFKYGRYSEIRNGKLVDIASADARK